MCVPPFSEIMLSVSYSPEYREMVEEKLSGVVMITTKAMFGGVGIYSEGLFFALIAEDKLYFKVDDTNMPEFEEAGMQPFFPCDSPKPMKYWELPPGLLDDPKELAPWVDKAVRVAENAQRKKKK